VLIEQVARLQDDVAELDVLIEQVARLQADVAELRVQMTEALQILTAMHRWWQGH
jgi:hypothetical protein